MPESLQLQNGRRFGKAVMGNDPNSAAKGNYTQMNKLDKGTTDMNTMMPAGFAKNFAKAQSFSKSAKETLGQWAKAMEAAFGENFPGSEAIGAIQQSMQKVIDDDAEKAWGESGGGKAQGGSGAPEQPTAPAEQPTTSTGNQGVPEREEELNDSYDPTRNTKGQRLMLESIR